MYLTDSMDYKKITGTEFTVTKFPTASNWKILEKCLNL